MQCLINDLKKLKESASEAVETLESFSEFKKYMHIKRKIEDELLATITKANVLEGPQLILVCGGVGDGKSHLISYLKDKNPGLFYNFNLHNDATESDEPTMTAMETLKKKFRPYNDDNIKIKSNEKLIVAINLGTLNNFINSDDGENYTILKKYIETNRILDTTIDLQTKEGEGLVNFHFVNFSDYHLFSLTENGAESKYLSQIIDKITIKEESNIFYNSYKKNCLECKIFEKCPVKYNYEFLCDSTKKNKLIEIIIEMLVKYKTMISTRSFFNFIYEILVAQQIDSLPSKKIKSVIANYTTDEIVNVLIKTIIFEHRKSNKIFKDLSNLDPLNKRSKNLDETIIKFNTTKDVSSFIKNYKEINDNIFIKNLLSGDNESPILSRYMLRSIEFSNRDSQHIYKDYINYLFYINKNPKKAKNLFLLIRKGIYNWNGEIQGASKINIFPGKKQLKYKISKEFNIKSVIPNYERSEEILNKFYPNLLVKFSSNHFSVRFEIDFFLYELLHKITNGYKPNKKDYSKFVKFSNNVNKLISKGNQNSKVIIEDRLNNYNFDLEYDEFGDLNFTFGGGI